MTDIRSMTRSQLTAVMELLGEPAFRVEQVFQWLHGKMADSFECMSNLPKGLRGKLAEEYQIAPVTILKKLVSQDEGVSKYLIVLDGGDVIETVLMRYDYGNTLCISSQAGCRMGCVFCQSSRFGFSRNLRAGEIAGQVYRVQKEEGLRISNVVVMGIGEPFDNYQPVLDALRLLNDKAGQNISQRGITVSTCGLAEGIYRFAEENTQINLAVSLHAPNDEIRAQLMPVARRWRIDELLAACNYYRDKTNRRVTYEYALAAGINDSPRHAKELGIKLKGALCHVNLLHLSETGSFKKTTDSAAQAFAKELKRFGVESTLRRGRGEDIEAACGQLRNCYLNE